MREGGEGADGRDKIIHLDLAGAGSGGDAVDSATKDIDCSL